MAHQLTWEPGSFGKGLVLPDGAVHTWPINGANGGPHHADHLGEDMSYTPRVQRECHAFEITPQGEVTFSPLTTEKHDYVESVDDRLRHNADHFMLAHEDGPRENQFQLRLREGLRRGWQPGTYGKGIVDANGQVHSWNVGDYHDGLPSHHDVEKHLGTNALVYFSMNPDGAPHLMNAGYDRVTNRELPFAQLAPHYTTAHKFLEQTSGRKRDDWDFARVASRDRWLKAWDDTLDRPHRFKETEMVPIEALKPFKEWSRDIDRSEYTRDLRDHIAEHGITGTTFLDYNPDTGHGHLSEGNHRLEIAEQLGLTHLPVTVYRSQRTPREGQWAGHPLPKRWEPDLSGLPPDTPEHILDHYRHPPEYIRPSEVGLPSQPVHTAASAFTTEIPGPFAVQLTEFLDQVGREQAHKEGPTPHHDSIDEFNQQPGILARIRNKFQSKGVLCPGCGTPVDELPCQLCGYSDQPSFEQQERDWYDSDPVGAPTKWPFQSEPWRTEHHAPTIGLASLQKGTQSVSEHVNTSLPKQAEAKAAARVSGDMQAQGPRRRREPKAGSDSRRPGVDVSNVLDSMEIPRTTSGRTRPGLQGSHHSRQNQHRIRTIRVGNHPPEVVWHGAQHEMQGDHSFFYDRESNKVHIGSPELHHHDLRQLTGHDIYEHDPNYTRYAIGSISGTNVNMDEGYREDRARITQALGLPEPTDDWRFGQVNR